MTHCLWCLSHCLWCLPEILVLSFYQLTETCQRDQNCTIWILYLHKTDLIGNPAGQDLELCKAASPLSGWNTSCYLNLSPRLQLFLLKYMLFIFCYSLKFILVYTTIGKTHSLGFTKPAIGSKYSLCSYSQALILSQDHRNNLLSDFQPPGTLLQEEFTSNAALICHWKSFNGLPVPTKKAPAPEREHSLLPQSMSLWDIDSLRLINFKKQHTWEKV